MKRAGQRGFSLIELMVAMVITLIITGAIYGLMASGQNAFRREPALVERQQSIRIGMDLMVRDIQNAGVGMIDTGVAANAFIQVFTNTLNNPAAQSVVSEINPGERADFIEILSNDGSCPAMSVCGSPGANLFTTQPLPACMFGTPAGPVFGFVSGTGGPASSNGTAGLLWLEPPSGGMGGGCGSGHVNTPPGQNWVNPPGGGCNGGNNNSAGTNCQSVSRIAMVRYELAPENPAAAVNAITNPPSLWRSEFGRRNLDGSANNGPFLGANSPWQLIARGIDDLQVQYQNGTRWPLTAPGTWDNVPGVVSCGAACGAPTVTEFNTIVQRVRVSLSSRALGVDVGGETRYAAGGSAGRRGQLTTIVSPRAALAALQSGNFWR